MRLTSKVHGSVVMAAASTAWYPEIRRRNSRMKSPECAAWKGRFEPVLSIDFLTIPTATVRVLFVFFILRHDRRCVLHFGITEFPSAAWTAQQIIEAFPEDTAPR